MTIGANHNGKEGVNGSDKSQPAHLGHVEGQQSISNPKYLQMITPNHPRRRFIAQLLADCVDCCCYYRVRSLRSVSTLARWLRLSPSPSKTTTCPSTSTSRRRKFPLEGERHRSTSGSLDSPAVAQCSSWLGKGMKGSAGRCRERGLSGFGGWRSGGWGGEILARCSHTAHGYSVLHGGLRWRKSRTFQPQR